ncbi:uncharacterized protein RMCB_5696 [Mycolicibacterium brisbanense]|uniref:Uncharacterized protein n=1 Tax=Mycolicibacterium brisbanense TaxID=146020 RepID=A0A100W4R8_9MYCO|nr:uncharacterized protein RMCB_5696 [Mycolicibacterium brisbanense]
MIPKHPGPCAADVVRVDDFDWDIVTFILRWAPYGGPSEEECWPRFGMTCAQLHTRFADIMRKLGGFGHANLSDRQRELVRQGQRLLATVTGEPTPVPSTPDVRLATDLSEAPGHWSLRQGVWHWTSCAR